MLVKLDSIDRFHWSSQKSCYIVKSLSFPCIHKDCSKKGVHFTSTLIPSHGIRITMGVSSHTSHKEFENGTVFPFRPTVHTHPLRKRNFSNLRNLNTPAFRFSVNRKYFEHRGFWKQWHHNNNVISLFEFSLTANLKWPVIVAFVKEKQLTRFQSETHPACGWPQGPRVFG